MENPLKNRELVMLAKDYNPDKNSITGMWASEKLDGMRCLWLPHTKGLPISEVHFANRQRDNRDHICSGLWSRYGKVIHCPDAFTKVLPHIPLDGELWMGRGKFQELMSTVKQLNPDSRWQNVMFKVFDAPDLTEIYSFGTINNPNYSYRFSENSIPEQINVDARGLDVVGHFEHVYYQLRKHFPFLDLHEQVPLPFWREDAEKKLHDLMETITSGGGEGVILRNPSLKWTPYRMDSMLKVKPYLDDEATIVAVIPGKGRLKGMMGALKVQWGSVEFDVGTGFSDRQRKEEWVTGEVITFRYRELSSGGTPKEGRFLRRFIL